MPGRTARRMTWAILLIVLLAVLVPPFVNVNRYRKRVTEAIGRSLGREVTVSRIALKLLPRPGIVLSNFVVAENPSYGAEPMLRADTVTAFLRLTSLWRGRLEIGTLDLDSPSLNLVRRSDGHWNVEELVERASQVSSAPTTRDPSGSAPPLPLCESLERANQLQTRPGEEGICLHRCRFCSLAGVGKSMGHPVGSASHAHRCGRP